jgi:hypothetical protein
MSANLNHLAAISSRTVFELASDACSANVLQSAARLHQLRMSRSLPQCNENFASHQDTTQSANDTIV